MLGVNHGRVPRNSDGHPRTGGEERRQLDQVDTQMPHDVTKSPSSEDAPEVPHAKHLRWPTPPAGRSSCPQIEDWAVVRWPPVFLSYHTPITSNWRSPIPPSLCSIQVFRALFCFHDGPTPTTPRIDLVEMGMEVSSDLPLDSASLGAEATTETVVSANWGILFPAALPCLPQGRTADHNSFKPPSILIISH
jgi:hypothetical protein